MGERSASCSFNGSTIIGRLHLRERALVPGDPVPGELESYSVLSEDLEQRMQTGWQECAHSARLWWLTEKGTKLRPGRSGPSPPVPGGLLQSCTESVAEAGSVWGRAADMVYLLHLSLLVCCHDRHYFAASISSVGGKDGPEGTEHCGHSTVVLIGTYLALSPWTHSF